MDWLDLRALQGTLQSLLKHHSTTCVPERLRIWEAGPLQTCHTSLSLFFSASYCRHISVPCRRPWFNSWVRKICWRRDRLPTPVFLGFLVPQLVKNLPAMWEPWVRSLSWEDPLEKGKATHSSILAWRIPWTAESMGLQRVEYNSATFTDSLNLQWCLIELKYF